LRRSPVAFLHDFTPRANPHVIAKGPDATQRRFDDGERHGAEVFRDHCASCHQPKLVGDDADTLQSFFSWERLVLSDNDPLTFSGDAKRVKTGIEPYVHEEGARPSSLRRISFKRPYFTNGTSTTLDDVVARFRFTTNAAADTAFHAAPPSRTDLASLKPEDQRALVAFLRLL
jgi:cytochrome c peroxidase